MPNNLLYSHLNPVNFVAKKVTEYPTYIGRHMDDYWHRDRLTPWQHLMTPFYQVWMNSDSINLQLITNAGTPTVKLLNSCVGTVYTGTMTQKQNGTTDPTFYIYEISVPLTGIDEGVYFMTIESGISPNIISMISEPMFIASTQPNTLLIEYVHKNYFQSMVFETGFIPSIRVKALLQLKQLMSKDTIYEDQILDEVMVRSKPFRIWDFKIGVETPIPDFMIDKVNRIFGCSSLKIDGREYTKNDGFKWEESDNVGYGSLKAYSIELRERYNNSYKEFEPTPTSPAGAGIFTEQYVTQFV